jgi:cytochrome c biogenesis protein CcdA
MVFAQITSLALVDAVNPCTLAVMTLLLSSLIITKNKKEVLLGGLLFTATIFVMYALYGIGLLQIIYALGIEAQVRMVLKVLLVLMALVELNAYFSYKQGFVSMEMPMKLRPIAKKTLQSIESPIMVIPAAALCSVLLLPCSSGPYVAALAILSQYSFWMQLSFLIYYNLLFTLPMLLITFGASFGTSPQRVVQWKEKHIRKLHLAAGILLIAVLFMV